MGDGCGEEMVKRVELIRGNVRCKDGLTVETTAWETES